VDFKPYYSFFEIRHFPAPNRAVSNKGTKMKKMDRSMEHKEAPNTVPGGTTAFTR
jgi:hypothetical protein